MITIEPGSLVMLVAPGGRLRIRVPGCDVIITNGTVGQAGIAVGDGRTYVTFPSGLFGGNEQIVAVRPDWLAITTERD